MNRTVCRLLVVAMMAALLSFVAQPPQALAALAAPSNLSPSGVSQSGSPVLQWSRVGKAVKYEVQLATDPGFTTLKYFATTTNHRATPTMTLPQQELFWRVRSVNASNVKSNWAETSYTASEIAGPSLVAPVDDLSGSEPLQQPDQPALLTWTPVPNAVSYTIEVDDSDDFVGAKTYASKTTSYLFQAADPTVPLNSWRVRAVFSGSYNTTWSDVGHFTIGALVAPTLTAPIDSPTTQVTDAVLDWEPVPGAVKYEVQVDTNDQFVDPLADKATVYSTWYAKPATLDNDQYWWRVRAIDVNGNASPWASSLNQFQRSWKDDPTSSTRTTARWATRSSTSGTRSPTPARTGSRSPRTRASTARETCTTLNTTYTPISGLLADRRQRHLLAGPRRRQPHQRAAGSTRTSVSSPTRPPIVTQLSRRTAPPSTCRPSAGRTTRRPSSTRVTIRKANGSGGQSKTTFANSYTPTGQAPGSAPTTVRSAGPFKPWSGRREVPDPDVRQQPDSSTSPATSWTPLLTALAASVAGQRRTVARFPNLTWEPAFDGDWQPGEVLHGVDQSSRAAPRRRPWPTTSPTAPAPTARTTGSVPGSTTGTSPHTSPSGTTAPARRVRSRSSTSPR